MKRNRKDEESSSRIVIIVCYVAMVLFSVALPALVRTTSNVHYRSVYSNYAVGEIAEATLYAKGAVDLIDSDATEQKRLAASDAVLPIFSYSPTKTMEIVGRMDLARKAFLSGDYSTLSSIMDETIAQKLFDSGDSYLLSIAYDIVKDVCSRGFFNMSDIDLVEGQGYKTATVSNLSGGSTSENTIGLDSLDLLSSSTISTYVSDSLSGISQNLTSKQVLLLEEIVFSVVEPNVLYDEELTLQRRQSAAQSIQPVVISIDKGDVLIEANRVVTQDQIKLIEMLSTHSGHMPVYEFLGILVLDAIGLGFGVYVFGMFLSRKNLHYVQFHIILAVSYVLSIVATYFLVLWSSNLRIEFNSSFFPIFFLPIFITMASGYKRLGVVSVFMLAMTISTLPNASVMTFFYCVLCGSVGVLLVRFFNKRIDMVYQWFFSCLFCSAVTILFVIIDGAVFTDIFMILLGVLLNVSAAYVLLSVTMPIVEKLFNLPTVFRLYELAYRDTPVLTRLSQAAPGTYSHSRAVADLAEAGARAIGANALLARVGGLYHDIGKVEHPEYFVENQSGVNKHDDISPSLSVAVIKSHVKVGADKGRDAGLPPEVIKIIGDHHGNDVIQYFYHEALESQAASQDGKGETVKASDYSYNADIPDFPECGIVMLADSIEAASRTVTPNAGKFAKLIDSIFLGKIERGQLDDSGLTMHDIKVLGESFVKTLVARYHSRIEYPDDDED